VKDHDELSWVREATVDVTYMTGGVEDRFAPELVRTDQVASDEAGAAVHVDLTVIRFADDAHHAIRGQEARRSPGGVGRLHRGSPMSTESGGSDDGLGWPT
jgi:hypothetical protein